MTRVRTALAVGALLLGVSDATRAQAPAEAPRTTQVSESVYVRDLGPGRPGRLLRDALAGRRLVLRPRARVVVGKDDVLGATTVVLGPRMEIDGRVSGDLIIVGGDAFVHPGAVVEGRAIGIGGCVYPSKLGTVQGGITCYEDETFDLSTDARGRLALSYRPLLDRSVALLQWPLGVGLRIPTYDRVNGVSIGVGPVISLDTGRFSIEPLVTYRSNLGDFDPAVKVTGELGRRTVFEAMAQRGTFTNERWIRDTLVNSLMSIVMGVDARNYYRADRIDAYVQRRWEGATSSLQPWVGARTERAWSAGLDTTTRRSGRRPWSIFNRNDVESGMRRPNPHVLHDRITSALAGARAEWEDEQGMVVRLDLGTEAALGAPSGRGFVQGVLDADASFPVIRDHVLSFQLHALYTASDSTPPQRYSYVGGSGTIPTRDLLEMGGDRLLHLDSRYAIPLSRPKIPFLGTPRVMIRHVIGSAGVGDLPAFVQNVGGRVTVGFVRADVMIDPASSDRQVSVGISLGR